MLAFAGAKLLGRFKFRALRRLPPILRRATAASADPAKARAPREPPTVAGTATGKCQMRSSGMGRMEGAGIDLGAVAEVQDLDLVRISCSNSE